MKRILAEVVKGFVGPTDQQVRSRIRVQGKAGGDCPQALAEIKPQAL
jgi:hypothetical protein